MSHALHRSRHPSAWNPTIDDGHRPSCERRSAAKQQAAGDGVCARVSFREVDALIYNNSLPHFDLELLGVQRVRP